MLIIPYTVNLQLAKVPWLTIGISLLCLILYARQEFSSQAFNQASHEFCSKPLPRLFDIAVQRIEGSAGPDSCHDLLTSIRLSSEPQQEIARLLAQVPALAGIPSQETRAYLGDALEHQYRAYVEAVPGDLTAELWFVPSSFSPWRMVTSSFAHADWGHVIFNVLFFGAFAATVEVCLGWGCFLLVTIGASLFIGCCDGLVSAAAGTDVPTLGLSGVVMTMMTLLAYLLPRAGVRCFVWLFLFIRTMPIPVWILAAWFVGGDIYSVFAVGENSEIDFLAHVAGGAFGFLVGVLFFRRRKLEVREMAKAAGVRF